MTGYRHSRRNCWDLLTNAVRVRVPEGDYVIDPDTFHKVRKMLLAKASTKHTKKSYDLELWFPDITESLNRLTIVKK